MSICWYGRYPSTTIRYSYWTVSYTHLDVYKRQVLDIEAFKAWRPEYQNAEFILEDGKYICGWAIEKMSKSMFNVVNPDMICLLYTSQQ